MKKILAQLCESNLAFFANTVLRGPPDPPFKGKFLIGQHHETWSNLVNEHDQLCILAPRGHGKCSPGATEITAADGRQVPIAEWRGGELLAFDPRTQRLGRYMAPAAQPNGVEPVRRFRTRTGLRIEVTANHPLLRFTGWTPAHALKVGDRIAAPRRLPEPVAPRSIRHPWLLGVVHGAYGARGRLPCAWGHGQLTISAIDKALQDDLCEMAAQAGWEYRLWRGAVRLLAPVDPEVPDGDPSSWLNTEGFDVVARGRPTRAPSVLWQAPNADLAEFFRGFVQARASLKNKLNMPKLPDPEERVLYDYKLLLLRLGVLSVLEAPGPRKPGALVLQRRDYERLLTLEVPPEPTVLMAPWAPAAPAAPSGAARSSVAPAAQGAHKNPAGVHTKPSDGSESWHPLDIFPEDAWEILDGRGPHTVLTRTRFEAPAAAGDPLAQLHYDSDCFWDEIVTIEDLGALETWALSVPGPENYVADGVVSHNSHFFTVAYAIWMASKHPNRTGLILSGGDAQAREQLAKIKKEIEENPKLSHLLPEQTSARGTKWTDNHIRLANGHEIIAKGFMTKIRGGHPIWIVLDDVVNDDSAFSDVIRSKVHHYFYSVIYNMKVVGTRIVVVGTPQHASDLYGMLAQNREFHFQKFQSVNYYHKNGRKIASTAYKPTRGDYRQALWPEAMSLEELDRAYRTQGALIFSRERQCDVLNDEATLFPLHLFTHPEVMMSHVCMGMPSRYWDEIGVTTRYIGVDFAISSSVGSDFTVIFVVGVDDQKNRWIIDIIRERGLDFQIQLQLIKDAYTKYQPEMIYCESNQFQRIFGDELIRTTDLPIFKVVTGVEKHSLERGLPSLRVLLENRKYRIPRGDPASLEKSDIWIKEMRDHTFTRGRVVSTGDHDDTVMAGYIAEQAIKAGTFNFSFGEQEGDQDAPDPYEVRPEHADAVSNIVTNRLRTWEVPQTPPSLVIRGDQVWEQVGNTVPQALQVPVGRGPITGFSEPYAEQRTETDAQRTGLTAPSAQDILLRLR